MFTTSKKYDVDSHQEAKQFVQGISANLGGTDIYEPVTSKVIRQLKNALQPCISDVEIQWGMNSNPVETEKAWKGCCRSQS